LKYAIIQQLGKEEMNNKNARVIAPISKKKFSRN